MILEINMLIYKKTAYIYTLIFKEPYPDKMYQYWKRVFLLLLLLFWTKHVVKTLKILYFYEHMLDKT